MQAIAEDAAAFVSAKVRHSTQQKDAFKLAYHATLRVADHCCWGLDMRRLLAAVIILCSCTALRAQPSELIIVGIGARPCADILKNYRDGPKAMSYLILTWAHGFWSSQNAMFLQTGVPFLMNLAGNDDAQVKALMAACERKPAQDFGIVVRDHFLTLPTMRNPQAKK